MPPLYGKYTASQYERFHILKRVQAELGDQFEDFIIDLISENGTWISIENLPALAGIWVKKVNKKKR